MASIVKILRVLADPNRLRILLLLKGEELSVAELQEILAMGQSTISTHLSQLKQAGLVEDRRTGKSNLYRLSDTPRWQCFWTSFLVRREQEIPEARADQAAMRRVLKKRQDKMRAFFDTVAGRLGKDYVPGKSWKSLAEALLRLLPPMVIADLGAGEGSFSLLLAAARRTSHCRRLLGQNARGRPRTGRCGMASRTSSSASATWKKSPSTMRRVDLVFFSQSLHHALHPERAVAEAARILRPGGRIVILDLAKHRFEEARELYADEWLGFSEAEIEAMLENAGFTDSRLRSRQGTGSPAIPDTAGDWRQNELAPLPRARSCTPVCPPVRTNPQNCLPERSSLGTHRVHAMG